MRKGTEHRWAVESVDADVARVEEDGTRMITIARDLLPAGVKAGQVLTAVRVGTSVTVELDEAATRDALAASKAQVAAVMAESKKQDPGGDVAL
jgi:hypothetical protein